MAEIDPQTQVFGEPTQVHGEQGEPCQECGSPLAADQRYCLNCGKRRGGPRVEYRQVIGHTGGDAPEAAGPSPASASASAAADERQERDYAPLAAVGGIAILGLMLLVGVLIGKGNNQATPAPAPVVTVGDTGGAATADTRSGKSEATAAKPKETAKKKKVKTGAEEVQGGLTGTAARNSDATVQATQEDLEALEGKSGESYEETVKKLPDKIATPGAPPPIDKSKPPGGGGGGETIE
jgi:hypothetical protein